MKEQLISFETAKLAKEKGFNEPTIDLWYRDKTEKPKLFKGHTSHRRFINCSELGYRGSDTSSYEESTITIKDLLQVYYKYPAKDKLYQAPTQSLLQKWLIEKYYVHIEIDALGQSNYHLKCGIIGKILSIDNGYKTYEEALEDGLYEALKLIKDEQTKTND